MHKITSNFYDMRKILRKKFWSQGTPLGYLGPGSQEAQHLGPCFFQILVIWGPYDYPVLVACQGQAKSLKTAGAWCGFLCTFYVTNFSGQEFIGPPDPFDRERVGPF